MISSLSANRASFTRNAERCRCLRRSAHAGRAVPQDTTIRSRQFCSPSFERTRRTSRLMSHKRSIVTCAATDRPSLQLATAKLPESVDTDAFAKALYDWASTMTSSGRNLPFSLPLRTRKRDSGFEISLLRISNGEPVSVGEIVASIESEQNVGSILFVRFYEGEGAQAVRSRPLPQEPQQRLKTVVDGLVDVPLIMSTMKSAIKQAVAQAR